jgi:Tfp pilus assembly protein PilE
MTPLRAEQLNGFNLLEPKVTLVIASLLIAHVVPSYNSAFVGLGEDF